MEPNFIDNIKKPEQLNADETLLKHDIQLQRIAIKLLELDTRLNSLENLVNAMHNKIPVWWEQK